MNLVCDYCGITFERPHPRGPIPKFCSDACRQGAHRVRMVAGDPGHEMRLDWRLRLSSEHGGFWLVCSCDHEAYLGEHPLLPDVIAVARQHQVDDG